MDPLDELTELLIYKLGGCGIYSVAGVVRYNVGYIYHETQEKNKQLSVYYGHLPRRGTSIYI